MTADPYSIFVISKARQEALLAAARRFDRPSPVGRPDAHGSRLPRAAADGGPRIRLRPERQAA